MMELSKGFKVQTVQFENRTFYVSLSHKEIGLADPTSVQELRDTAAELSLQAEALVLIEMVKCGRIQPSSIAERLRPWLPSTQP